MVQILHAKRELRDMLADFSAEDIFHTACSTPPSVQTTTGRT
jgi:hypothetical protein